MDEEEGGEDGRVSIKWISAIVIVVSSSCCYDIGPNGEREERDDEW